MLRRERRQRVLVWDANPFNPYGAEVSRVIATAGYRVTRYCRKDMTFGPSQVSERPVIPTATGGNHSVGLAIRHVAALARFLIVAAITRPTVILPWTETHERPAFLLLARLGIPLLLVVHNPVAGRDEAEADPRLAELRRRARRLIVHTERLSESAGSFGAVAIAPHPSYLGWVQHMERQQQGELPARSESHSVALYLGSARADKGFDTLPELAALLTASGMRLSAAVGMMSDAQRAELVESGNVDVPPAGKRYLSDAEVYCSLLSSDVLVAPYQNVTVSGTTIMAVTMGLPVVAFDSPAMADLLDAQHRVEPGDLVEMTARVVEVASGTDRESAANSIAARLDKESSAGWRTAIDSTRGAR